MILFLLSQKHTNIPCSMNFRTLLALAIIYIFAQKRRIKRSDVVRRRVVYAAPHYQLFARPTSNDKIVQRFFYVSKEKCIRRTENQGLGDQGNRVLGGKQKPERDFRFSNANFRLKPLLLRKASGRSIRSVQDDFMKACLLVLG